MASSTAESRAFEVLKRVGGKVIPVETPPSVADEKGAATPPAKIESAPASDDAIFDLQEPKAPEAPPQAEPVKADLQDDDLEGITDDVEKLADPDAYNSKGFKALRSKLQEKTKILKAQETELAELRKKAKDYEDGLAVPELTQKQADRIAYLERFEKLYALKQSPVYEEKFAKPIRAEQERLKKLAEEYQVPLEKLNEAFAAGNVAETNRILSASFRDDVGAIEAKSIFREIKKIQDAAAEAEKEPEITFAKMQEENAKIVQERIRKANEGIVNVAKESWGESLQDVRQTGKFPELTFREGDTEHNETYVRPTLTKASQEYGRIVRELGKHGLTALPKDVATALARMTQYAHGYAIAAVQRDAALARVAELEGLMQQRGWNRPSVSGTAPDVAPRSPSVPMTPEARGMRLLEKSAGKRA